jgi:hypothetical protein
MLAERVSMRQAREIIRLKFSTSLPTREIARRLGLAPSTVRELSRLESAALSWPLPEGIGDAELEVALYANRRSKRGHRRHAEPDWSAVHSGVEAQARHSADRLGRIYRGQPNSTHGDNNPSASEARDPGGIIPLRWAALSRYTRAGSAVSAITPKATNRRRGFC